MEQEILKINILAITISGLLMLVFGLGLYFFRDYISTGGSRFFLPIPPIGVAAYIYVFNMFKNYDCRLPEKTYILFSELLYASLISGAIFFIFVVSLIFTINFVMR